MSEKRDKTYISDVIDRVYFHKSMFNLIASGCGTGKTRFVSTKLLEMFNEVQPYEVLFLTSRTAIADQQSKEKNISKYDHHSIESVRYWNGEIDDNKEIEEKGIQILTYDKVIDILKNQNSKDHETLEKIKIVVIDECHALFSDTFIRDIEALKVWIHGCIERKNKLIIGLTATPNILYKYNEPWGVNINKVNPDILINYKAKQLICTNFDTIPYLITTNKLLGKTIIMCCSIKDCYKLQSKLYNAAVLVSKSNKDYYMPEMNEIRDCITYEDTLPEFFTYVYERDEKKRPTKYERRKLEVLLTTSTLREGINLEAKSGVKNVICCYGDELHIAQFMGRCRFDIDNLVVAETYIRIDNCNTNGYLLEQRDLFKQYMDNKLNIRWFESISHIVDHNIYDIKKFIIGKDEAAFINYIAGKWLVSIGVKEEDLDKYKIYKASDKAEIVQKAVECKLCNLYSKKVTFNRVINIMKNMGYEIDTGKQVFDKIRYTYKLVLSFDDGKRKKQMA